MEKFIIYQIIIHITKIDNQKKSNRYENIKKINKIQNNLSKFLNFTCYI